MISRKEYNQRIIKHTTAHLQENKQEIISNPDPSCTECYPITEQPSEAFENFWYFWIVFAIKGEQFNSITVRAFEKALTLEENSEALGKCFELIIQSIRYQPLAQESLETLLTDLESAWNSYLEFDCWELETSIKSGTNSKSNSKGTSRKSSRKSSNASKMDGDTFRLGTSTSGRRVPENRADSHREWAAILNNIFSDRTFKQKYEEMTSEGDKRSAWDTIKNNQKYFSGKYAPDELEKPHIRYYSMMNRQEKDNPLKDSNPWTNPEDKDLTITEYDNTYQNDQDDEDPGSTWNIGDTTFSPIQNMQERRNIYQNTTDNRREDTDNREEQRRPEGGNDVIAQFLQGFGDLLKAHTATPHPIAHETRLVNFPEFKGGNQDPIEWLEAFEQACKANRVADNRILDILPNYLKGTALTWFSKGNIIYWRNNMLRNRSFVHQFKDHYCSIFRKQQWKHQLQNLKQRNGETIDEYVAQITELWKRLDPQGMRQEVDKIAEFIEGLRPEFIVTVQSSLPRTVDEAINKALALETAYSIGMELSAYSMIPNYLQGMSGGFVPARTSMAMFQQTLPINLSQHKESMEDMIDRKLALLMSKLEEQNKPNNNNNNNSNNRSNNRDIRTCHKCNKVGHIAKDCRSGQRNSNSYNNNKNNSNSSNDNNNAKVCYNCNKTGHFAKNCWSNQNNNGSNNYNNKNRNNQQNNRQSSGGNWRTNSSINHLN